MIVCRDKSSLHQALETAKIAKHTIGFVPTMGAIHDGHISLVQKSIEHNDVTVVSIFVNPAQFGPNEDLDSYPRTFENDCNILEKAGCTIIFAPHFDEIYPQGITRKYDNLPETFRILEGTHRPLFFGGIAEVVETLFDIVAPQNTYFGQKDYQQTLLIDWLIEHTKKDIQLHICPIYREPNGLAMSSRNVYLNKQERTAATILYTTLRKVDDISKTETDVQKLEAIMLKSLQSEPLVTSVDYAVIRNKKTLKAIKTIKPNQCIALIALTLGSARLIDNMVM